MATPISFRSWVMNYPEHRGNRNEGQANSSVFPNNDSLIIRLFGHVDYTGHASSRRSVASSKKGMLGSPPVEKTTQASVV